MVERNCYIIQILEESKLTPNYEEFLDNRLNTILNITNSIVAIGGTAWLDSWELNIFIAPFFYAKLTNEETDVVLAHPLVLGVIKQ